MGNHRTIRQGNSLGGLACSPYINLRIGIATDGGMEQVDCLGGLPAAIIFVPDVNTSVHIACDGVTAAGEIHVLGDVATIGIRTDDKAIGSIAGYCISGHGDFLIDHAAIISAVFHENATLTIPGDGVVAYYSSLRDRTQVTRPVVEIDAGFTVVVYGVIFDFGYSRWVNDYSALLVTIYGVTNDLWHCGVL